MPFAQADTVVLVSEEYAKDEARRQLLSGAVGAGVRLVFQNATEAAAGVASLDADPLVRAILIFASPKDMLAFLDAGAAAPREVNVGGIHYAISRLSLGRYQTFSEEDKGALGRLIKMGIRLDARATPWDESVDLGAMLG